MKRKNKIVIHLIYWFYLTNQLLFPFYVSKVDKNFFLDAGLSLGLHILIFYTFYLSLPFLLKKRNIFRIITRSVLLFGVLAVVSYLAEFLIWKYVVHVSEKEMSPGYLWLWSIRLAIVPTIYAILIRVAIDWFETQKLKADLITQTQASELALLRSQVNPHFLFNTLNNIYSLVYRKQGL